MKDLRCLQHDHHFPMEEMYDEDSEEPLPTQMQARCTRCGITLQQSFQELLEEIEHEMSTGGLVN